MPETNYDIFISFKDRDSNSNRTVASRLAEDIYDTLDVKGYRVFYSRYVLPGMVGGEYEPVINHALETAKLLVLVFTNSEEVNSEWVKHEWKYFSKYNKPILTVFKDCGNAKLENLPYVISQLQYCDLTDGSKRQYEFMLKRIAEIMSPDASSAPSPKEEKQKPDRHPAANQSAPESKPIQQTQPVSQSTPPPVSHLQLQVRESSVDNSPKAELKSSSPAIDADSLYELGEMYADFDGEEHDYKKAFESYIKAANAEHAEANYRIGYMYANGLGVKKDVSRDVKWYEKAAGYGSRDAMFALGEYTHQNKDYTKSVEWYTKAAEAGHIEAMVSLGKMLRAEKGVKHKKENEVKAFEWFTKAAEAGNDEAMCRMGQSYEYGWGTKIDEQKAIECYTKAADVGNTEAMRAIARMYEWNHFVKEDGEKAIEWYTRAFDAGEHYALIDIADMYEKGRGVKKDKAKAYELYAKAAEWYTQDVAAQIG